MRNKIEKKIDSLKERLSSDSSHIKDGKTLVEVSLSDLNELLDIVYETNNYRLNCI